MLWIFSLALLLLSQTSTLLSQPTPPPNRVLHLDGTNSFVQLPPNIFDSLTQATVEGWVKWERLRNSERLFDFGDMQRELYVRPEGPELVFQVASPDGTRNRLQVSGLLRSNEWCHIAAVSGPGGQKVYFNGVRVGTNAHQGSFASLRGRNNYLGKTTYTATDPTTRGQLDEVRVWNQERTPEQIVENMLKKLSGSEPGLVGYWSFDDGSARDRSPGRHDGKLVGAAKIIDAELPPPATLRRVETATIAGRVTEPDGRLAAGAELRFYQDGNPVPDVRARTELSGEYRLTFVANRRPYELRVVKADLGYARTNVLFFETQTNTWDFTLAETALSGQLYSSDNQPQPAVKVELLRVAGQTVTAATLTDADGNFRFKIPAPGSYRLRTETPAGPVLLNDGRAVEMALGNQVTAMNFEVAARKPAATGPVPTANRVLQLNGTGAHARLPAGIFGDLEESTIEGWVKWDRLTKRSRFFDFGKQSYAMYVESGPAEAPEIHFRIATGSGTTSRNYADIAVPALRTNQWVHVAAVSGRQGMRLYLNGLLIGSHPYTGGLRSTGNNDNNYLGRSNWDSDDYFQGQMDEVRVWVTARSQDQIRSNLFARLTGNETGLAGLWNFDGTEAKDATPNALHCSTTRPRRPRTCRRRSPR